MVGITLTAEQIRTAPAEVRRWIEREVAATLGLQPNDPGAAQPRPEHLVACTPEEAAAILSLIQGMFPVVSVFFELGRQGSNIGHEGLEAFRLADISRHTRLQNLDQLIAFLEIINDAVRRVRGDPAATLFVLDNRGDCIVATQTRQSISLLWQRIANGPEPLGPQPEKNGTASGTAPGERLSHAQEEEKPVSEAL